MTSSSRSASQPTPHWSPEALLTAIDSCHNPVEESRDPQRPELAGLDRELASQPAWQAYAEQSAAFDRAVADALEDDVEVPRELLARVLGALSAEVEAEPSETIDTPVVPAPKPSRRRWLRIASAAAAIAASAALMVWWQSPSSELDYEQLLDRVELWQAGQGEHKAHPLTEQAPPRGFEPPAEVALTAETQWVRVSDVLGRKGVLYSLSGRFGPRATLLVLEARGTPRLPGLPNTPPRTPRTTHNRSAAAWISGTRIYVLVVEGTAEQYRSYLPGGGSIA